MRTRLTLLIGFGTGYVLGSRAGRERYEQIVRVARQVSEHPTVQETTGVVQAQASTYLSTAKAKAADKLETTGLGEKLPPQLGEKVGGMLGRPIQNGGTGAAMPALDPAVPSTPSMPPVQPTTRPTPSSGMGSVPPTTTMTTDALGTTEVLGTTDPLGAIDPLTDPLTDPLGTADPLGTDPLGTTSVGTTGTTVIEDVPTPLDIATSTGKAGKASGPKPSSTTPGSTS